MRSAALLLGGMCLAGLGVGLMLGEVPGRWILGPLLVVAGLALKTLGVLGAGDPAGGLVPGDRRAVTLGGAGVERPRAGIPAGRAPLRSGRPGPEGVSSSVVDARFVVRRPG